MFLLAVGAFELARALRNGERTEARRSSLKEAV